MKRKVKKRKPEQKDIRAARALLIKIEKQKDVIAKDRTLLRDMSDDLYAILESVETGEQDIDAGLRQIESGLDTMSQYI